LLILFIAAVWAGAQNALAGGGTFLTLPALMASGLDARAANITSSLGLFPGQVNTAWLGRALVSGVGQVSFGVLAAISVLGGMIGAGLLLLTPPVVFAALLPGLVLFATVMFAWGSFRPPKTRRVHVSPVVVALLQFVISVYGGYFGGGIGFLMLAVFTAAGFAVRAAGATKNALAMMMNASTVLILIFTPGISWLRVAVVAVGALIGGYFGMVLMRHINERYLRIGIVLLGLTLTVGLFLGAHRPSAH